MDSETRIHPDQEAETRHLDMVLRFMESEIDSLRTNVEKNENGILSFQEDISDEISHGFSGSLYGSESFEQLVEASQFSMQMDEEIKKYERSKESLEILERLILSPYFARIDFTFSGETDPSNIYIGRNSFMHELDILVHDWRSPIAGLFYKYGLGEASYIAPSGTITGDVSLKRQYQIKDRKLEFFFDTDVEILDEYLCGLLSQNASSQMKGIVETIQREQDIAIRDDKNKILAIQGVAGSGKTSVALHRIAYLMYKGLTERLDSNDIAIISPNNIFEQYISNVLPELGEKNVRSFILEDLYSKILGKSVKIQSRYSLMEQILSGEGNLLPVMESSLKFKSSVDFVKILNALKKVGDLYKDIKSAYKELFDVPGKLQKLAKEAAVTLPDNIDDIIEFTSENLGSRKLFFDDASAIVYLYLKKADLQDYHNIMQVVVDEVQDYSPIHFLILKMLFPKAKYTVLGDINQTINKPETMNFYDDVLKIIGKEPSKLITLNKSFRSTREITAFASGLMGQRIDSFGRNGSEPVIRMLNDENDMDVLIEDAKECLDKGYSSIGIICKTNKECKKLHKRINTRSAKGLDVKLLEDTYDESPTGVFILPIYLSKGLEFDASFVWIADDFDRNNVDDKSLLFIACTRALHELRIYTGKEELGDFLNSLLEVEPKTKF